MTLTVHLCALLLLLCSSTSCLGSQYERCLGDSTCGFLQFSYPFGKTNSGCGDPDFQLHCDVDDDKRGYPLLNISGNEFQILEPSVLANNSNHTMTIAHRDNRGNKCSNLSEIYSPFWRSASHFHFADTYTNLLFWGYCDDSMVMKIMEENSTSVWNTLSFCGDYWHSGLVPEAIRFCQTYFQFIPFNYTYIPSNSFRYIQINQTYRSIVDYETLRGLGFKITWNVDQNRDQRCGACLTSKGRCGYDISEPTTFLCYCPDGSSQLNKCLTTGHEKKTAILLGCSFGGVALAAIAVLFLAFYAKRRKCPGSSTSKVEKFLTEYAYEMPTRYSQSRLKKITNNFAEKLGEGGYGVVYKGKLPNGALVAVKLLDRHRHGESQFMNEVATIGRVHHFNLVRLVGYCFESPTSALLYEYMVNGSLEKFIFAGKQKGRVLSWEQLYSIALGAARGVAYLHQDCDRRIIHFDIKPHNILLDADFTPKVSDFGLAKPCGKGEDHISMTGGRGTPGYVAPEVCDSELGPVTDKSDVYSFGMLLLEMVGGRKNFDWKVSHSSQFYFPEWAFKLLESGELGIRLSTRPGPGPGEGEMAMAMAAEDEEKARRLTKVGLWCIQYQSSDRPCMSRVVQMLEGNGDDVTNPPLPINSSAEPEQPLVSSMINSSSIEIRF